MKVNRLVNTIFAALSERNRANKRFYQTIKLLNVLININRNSLADALVSCVGLY